MIIIFCRSNLLIQIINRGPAYIFCVIVVSKWEILGFTSKSPNLNPYHHCLCNLNQINNFKNFYQKLRFLTFTVTWMSFQFKSIGLTKLQYVSQVTLTYQSWLTFLEVCDWGYWISRPVGRLIIKVQN